MIERPGRGPGDDDGAASLSAREVERRLRGRASLAAGPHGIPPTARRQILGDTATILSFTLLAVIAAQILGSGPGTGQPGPETPRGGSAVVVGSLGAAPTLPPPVTLGPVVNPRVGVNATPTPVPFETLGPTTLTVIVKVTNDDGGNDRASDWTISVSGARATTATFAGSASGTRLNVEPGRTFTIRTVPRTPGGYVESRSGRCTGPLPAGLQATCTIAENDRPVALTVKVVIDAGSDPTPPSPSSVTVSVTGSGVDRPSFAGSSAGTLVHLDANRAYSVTTSPASIAGYTRSLSSSCSSSGGLAEGRTVTCTITFTSSPAPTPPPPAPSGS